MGDAHTSHGTHSAPRFSGPLAWLVAAIIGMAAGAFTTLIIPAPTARPASEVSAPGSDLRVVEILADGTRVELRGAVAPAADQGLPPVPTMELWHCLPFALLLGGIALMPFINEKWWHTYYPEVSLFLGGLVVGFYLLQFGAHGRVIMLHTAAEYISFFALVGGLYVVSGGILVDVRARGTPTVNTAILAAGAVIANLVGTTGASMLLIRPFLRINSPEHGGRLRPLHVVFFIFIVSNCGGCLTPIGDPPLYLGFLKGVPFQWTLFNLWPMWLLVNGILLAVFFVLDSLSARRSPTGAMTQPDQAKAGVTVIGASGMICLALIVACVFIDPLLKKFFGIEHIPIGASCQLLVAVLAYVIAPRHIHRANAFNFAPVKEVGLLFVGIFATMAPALAYLDQRASSLGLESPTQFYFATGLLSACLDNAPTYLSFLQIAFSTLGLSLTPDEIARFLEGTFILAHPESAAGPASGISFVGAKLLSGISQGAVFFGAMTYIGNGPNFMVKAIAEGSGLRMPSFFGYLALSCLILGPVLVVNWFVFVR
ncbi:MAG: sodium:proton antiporter [Phycisphaerales bacterium]